MSHVTHTSRHYMNFTCSTGPALLVGGGYGPGQRPSAPGGCRHHLRSPRAESEEGALLLAPQLPDLHPRPTDRSVGQVNLQEGLQVDPAVGPVVGERLQQLKLVRRPDATLGFWNLEDVT